MAYCDGIRSNRAQGRLEALIAERAAPDADKEWIDRRIWDLFGERWAVMFTDLSGFSRHVAEFGIIHFLQVIYESQRLLVPVIEEYDGVLLKREGDSLLVMFRNPAKAVACSIAMQGVLARYNQGREASEQVLLCVGLGYGDVLRIGDEDVFGAEVNAASKLGEDEAVAGDILVTAALRDAVQGVEHVQFEPIEFVPPGADGAFRVVYADGRQPG
jgi:class 3 adenylate cyclase